MKISAPFSAFKHQNSYNSRKMRYIRIVCALASCNCLHEKNGICHELLHSNLYNKTCCLISEKTNMQSLNKKSLHQGCTKLQSAVNNMPLDSLIFVSVAWQQNPINPCSNSSLISKSTVLAVALCIYSIKHSSQNFYSLHVCS